ncbi:hypothetical protein JVX90_00110 [Gordonia sp. PDNC005]|uniref:hypothetical protein n=1 Tax=Gordonia sp. PDNC005 TaxID=2811424 RepID=UPI0019623667|nr:hypothetical protein [Gordonia sp. PDNC005]QRY62716.1 hypothetical protein JVX90_00110 [Gordonia sp. PDNC005]
MNPTLSTILIFTISAVIAVAGLNWLANRHDTALTATDGAPCANCGGDHSDTTRDPATQATAELLTQLVQSAILDVANLTTTGGRPAAAVIAVPGPGDTSEVRVVVHPDAYTDITELTSALATIARVLNAGHGQVNEDLHYLRIGKADQ